MSSKFWVCMALISVAVAHTYVYTDVMKHSGNESSVDMHYMLAKLKHELRSLLSMAKELSHAAREGIANFRTRTSQWRFERAQKMALEAARGRS